MNVVVVGTGYVGLVTGACLADVGHKVICVDHNEEKISRLQHGEIDIYEASLADILKDLKNTGHLFFCTSLKEALVDAELIMICVGTPPCADGATDLRYVFAVAEQIGQSLDHDAWVVMKSTVPVGTGHRVIQVIQNRIRERQGRMQVRVISNPEFLKEGSAVKDFRYPDRIVVGVDHEEGADVMRRLYEPYNRKRDKLIVMDVLSAELTKYAANAMLATKISFINEMANIASEVGADIEWVRRGIGADPRIGHDFIYPGCGYGGSCFPKDVKSLIHTAQEAGYQTPLLRAVDQVNQWQKGILLKHLLRAFGGNLSGKCIAVWGLSFKPGTNDIREAPSLQLIEGLLSHGAVIKAYDPVAIRETHEYFGRRDGLCYVQTKEDALHGADALAVCTEWKAFSILDFNGLRHLMRGRVIVDGRNLYDPALCKQEGFQYQGVGRGEIKGMAPVFLINKNKQLDHARTLFRTA